MIETLKAARINRKMQQEKVAKELGISRATLSSWENGRGYPRIDKVQKLAELYKKEPSEIIFTMEELNEK